jgi:hypothetical protein
MLSRKRHVDCVKPARDYVEGSSNSKRKVVNFTGDANRGTEKKVFWPGNPPASRGSLSEAEKGIIQRRERKYLSDANGFALER